MSEGDPDDRDESDERHDTGSADDGDDHPVDDAPADEDPAAETPDSSDEKATNDGAAFDSGNGDADGGDGSDQEQNSDTDGDGGGSEATPAGPSEDVSVSGAATTPEPPEAAAVEGAPDDQEMPLTAHIEEMIKRLLVVIVVMAIVSAVVFPFADRLINFLWYSFLPGQPTECVQAASAAANNSTAAANGSATAGSSNAACPRLYHPLSLVLARLKVASLSGFIIALPVFVYETYLFMRPGLYPNERRYYLASVPTSLILAGIGVLFAYLAVLPLIFTYFLGYSQPVADVAFGLSETFGLILLMLGMFAAIFQIPLFIMLAIMMGVTSRRWLLDRRLYFWFGFAGFAFLFSPDPTGMAPFIVALTMIALFEGTLLLLRWTGR